MRLTDAEAIERGRHIIMGYMVPLGSLPAGTRVQKPDAHWYDAAYLAWGTVVRDTDEGGFPMVGVLWDGFWGILQYPSDQRFISEVGLEKALAEFYGTKEGANA